MKCVLFVLFATVLGAVLCEYANYEEIFRKYRQNYDANDLAENLQRKLEKLCPNKTESEFESVLNDIQQCAAQIEVEGATYCSIIKNSVPPCLDSLIVMIEDCLPDQSKSLPKLIFKSITSIVDYVCHIDGEHIFELANDCVRQSSYRLRNCQRRISARLRQFQNKMPSKEDVCDTFISMKPCFVNHIENSCGNAITKEAYIGLYEAIIVPCGEINEVDEFK